VGDAREDNPAESQDYQLDVTGTDKILHLNLG
jgi:hypothetical protein